VLRLNERFSYTCIAGGEEKYGNKSGRLTKKGGITNRAILWYFFLSSWLVIPKMKREFLHDLKIKIPDVF